MSTPLQDQCAHWALTPEGAPAETTTSVIQRVRCSEGPALLKLSRGDSDEHAAPAILAWYGGHGSVRLLRADGRAQVLEWIDGPPLSRLVEEGRDDEACRLLAEVADKLHAPRAGVPDGLIPLDQRLQPLLERGDSGDGLHRRAAGLAASLLATARRVQPLHGDIHHDNILHHPARGWLAIDPKGLIGDRHYDLANALCNPVACPEIVRDPARARRQARILAGRLELDEGRLLAFAFCHACLAGIWCLEDGDDPIHWRLMAELVVDLLAPG